MLDYAEPVTKLIDEFKRLPGIGHKSAQRIAFHLLKALPEDAERLVEAVRGTRARVLVNDRFDVALAAGAHGVHLRGDSLPAVRARRMAPPAFIIGRSVRSRDEAMRAEDGGGLDYLVFGTVLIGKGLGGL